MGLFASKPRDTGANDSPRTGEVNVHVHVHGSSETSQKELAKPNEGAKRRINDLLLELEDREFMIRSTVHQQLSGLRSFHDILEHHLGNMENAVNALREEMHKITKVTKDSDEHMDTGETLEEVSPPMYHTAQVESVRSNAAAHVAEVRPFFESTMVSTGNQTLEPIHEGLVAPSNRRFGTRLNFNGYQHTDNESDSDSELDGIYTPDHD